MDTFHLSLLPEAVKRRILLHVSNCSEQNSNGSQTAVRPATDTPTERSGPVRPTSTSSSTVAKPGSVGQADTRNKSSSGARHVGMLNIPALNGGLAVVDGFLSSDELQAARACAEAALAEQQRAAGMGGSVLGWKDRTARGDVARWLHEEDERTAGRTALADVLSRMAALREPLQRMGFSVGGRATYQLACYPGEGARYVRHADRSDSSPSRRVTAILYLNKQGWDPEVDGGQLAVYNTTYQTLPTSSSTTDSASRHSDGAASNAQGAEAAVSLPVGYEAGEPATLISPLGGRLVVFESDIDHEVLPAHCPRWAVTVWFHCTPPAHPDVQTPQLPQPAATNMVTTSILQASTLQGAPTAEPGKSAAVSTNEGGGHRSEGQEVKDSCASESIFVSIAAYRDPECRWTIKDLFARATHPQRVWVGVVWQVDHSADSGIMRLAGAGSPASGPPSGCTLPSTKTAQGDDSPQPAVQSQSAVQPQAAVQTQTLPQGDSSKHVPWWVHHVRETKIDFREATGPCKARAMCAALWAGETYVLQIDSHMRFEQGWDEACIQQLHAAEAQLAAESTGVVLTTYPQGYYGSGAAANLPPDPRPILLCADVFDEHGMLRTRGRMLAPGAEQQLHALHMARADSLAAGNAAEVQAATADSGSVIHGPSTHGSECRLHPTWKPGDPLPCAAWAAGFSFSRVAALMEDAPYPPANALPHLFFGEELYIFARLWTRGWDFFSPGRPILYHQWQRSERKHTQAQDAVHVIGSTRAAAQRASQRQVLAVLGLGPWPEGDASKAKRARAGSSGARGVDDGGPVPADGAPVPAEWAPGGRWGLGVVRSLSRMEAHMGVDFRERRVMERARHAWLPEAVLLL